MFGHELNAFGRESNLFFATSMVYLVVIAGKFYLNLMCMPTCVREQLNEADKSAHVSYT